MARVRPLRSDGGVFAHEWHRAACQPVEHSARSVATGRGDAAVAIIAITARREDAAKMLLERNPGFFRNVCGVGIDGPKKIPDLLLNFPLYQELCTMGYGDLAWL